MAIELSWLPNGSQLLVGSVDEVWLVSRFGGAPRRIAGWGAYVAPSNGSQFAHSLTNLVGFGVSSLDGTEISSVKLQGFRWLLRST